jgi:hypothetical protein
MTRSGRAALLALLVIALFAPALIAPTGATAQTPAPVIQNAELRLWPEYDDPGLLVIFSGGFPAGTTYPLKLSIPVAEGARNVQATFQDASGNLINRPFEISNGRLNYEIPSGGFHVEYYVDRAASGDQRQISYDFEAPYAIDALRMAVQQPARSSGFALTPAAEGTEQGTDGLTYYVLNRRNVAAGEKINLAVNYTKTDTEFSAPQLSITSTGAPQQVAGAAPAASGSTATWLPWLLIGLGVALFAGILVYWLLSRRSSEPEPAPTPAAARPARPSSGSSPKQTPPSQRPLPTVPARPADAPKAAAVFCVNCGNALKAEDRFCSQCGTPRRS